MRQKKTMTDHTLDVRGTSAPFEPSGSATLRRATTVTMAVAVIVITVGASEGVDASRHVVVLPQ